MKKYGWSSIIRADLYLTDTEVVFLKKELKGGSVSRAWEC